ncbi:stress response protein nst1-like [Tetranychus urticae]|uniref:Uncharacterized protein n=1 Tax=Tetranychus urticae TaxID=32264 RepID=T1KP96_TETUR|nr:stress response protein nst1-like [Tetranychus urticae]
MARSSSRRRSRRQNEERYSKEQMLAEIQKEIDQKKEIIQSKGIDENKLREALIQEFISKARASRTRNDSEDGSESDASVGKSKRGGKRGRRGRRGRGRRRRSSSRSSRQRRTKPKTIDSSQDHAEDSDGNQTDDSIDSYPVTTNRGLTVEKMLESLIKKELNASEPDRDSPEPIVGRLRSSDTPSLTSTAKQQQKLVQLQPKAEPKTQSPPQPQPQPQPQPSKQDQQTQTPKIGRPRSRSPSLGRRKVRSSPNLTSTVSLLKDEKLEGSDDMSLMQIIFCFVALGFALIMFVKLLN